MISAYAPGRVELLGNHTDYNDGVVLGVAIDRGLTVLGHVRDDDVVSLCSNIEGKFEVELSALRPQTTAPWANYAIGVLKELMALGIPRYWIFRGHRKRFANWLWVIQFRRTRGSDRAVRVEACSLPVAAVNDRENLPARRASVRWRPVRPARSSHVHFQSKKSGCVFRLPDESTATNSFSG